MSEVEEQEGPNFDRLVDTKIDGWTVKKALSSGANGVVFLVQKMTKTKKLIGVMKLPLGAPDSLIWEQKVMLKTQDATNPEVRNWHLVRILEHGVAKIAFRDEKKVENVNYVVMECTPDNPVNFIHGAKNPYTDLGRNACEMLKAIFDLHHSGFLHRDLKPENMGCDNQNHLVLYDLGMARRFVNPDGELRPPRSYCGFRGTTEWASLWAEDGRDQGQVDDLFAWLYCINEWVNCLCNVPQAWSWTDADKLQGKEADKMNIVRQYCKLGIFPARFTLDGCPHAFYRAKLYLHSLGRNDAPDYFYLSLLAQEVKANVKRKSKPEPLNMERAKIDFNMLNLSLL